MKSFFVLAAAAVAAVSAEECDLLKLVPLLQDENVKACSAATKWAPPVPPTPEQYPAVCIDSCKAALTALEALGMGDCSIRGSIFLDTSLIKPVKANCKWGGGAATTPTTAPPTKAPTPGSSAPSSSTPVANTTTPAPVATTAAPVATTTPAPVATSPSPTPSSSATSLGLALATATTAAAALALLS